MRFILLTFFLCSCCLAQVPEGATRREVIERLGWPRSTTTAGDRQIMNYPTFTILMVNDRVASLTHKPHQPASAAAGVPLRPAGGPVVGSPTPSAVVAAKAPAVGRVAPVTVPVVRGPVANRTVSDPPRQRIAPTAVATSSVWSSVIRGLVVTMVVVGAGSLAALIYILQRKQTTRTTEGRFSSDPVAALLRRGPSSVRQPPLIRPDALKDGWSLRTLKEIEWHGFEKLVVEFYRARGHRAELTTFGADGGVDVEVFEEGALAPTLIVQCKAFDSDLIGVKLVRELYGVAAARGGLRCAFFTTSAFTADAEAFGQQVGMDLVSGAELLRRMGELPLSASLGLLEKATAGDYKTPTCPSCGVKMVLRTAGGGRSEGRGFWGCRNFPRCTSRLTVG